MLVRTTVPVMTLLLVFFAACGDSAQQPEPSESEVRTLHGQVTVQPRDKMFWGDVGDSCEGKSGYSDMRPGAQVVVRDGAGGVAAVGALDPGQIVEGRLGWPLACQFTFTVVKVPVQEFYTIEVSHRGEVAYSYDSLETQGWTVDLTLGD